MPRIKCHYLDCSFLDEGICTAGMVELDPDTGYWDAEEDELEEWEDMEEEGEDDWDELDYDDED